MKSKIPRFFCGMALAVFPLLAQDDASTDVATGIYTVNPLVSDQSGVAPNQDPTLINAWGIAFLPGGPWWMNANGTGLSLLYNGNGMKQPLVVTIPPPMGQSGPSAPTGIVSNTTSDFQLQPGSPALFLFATEDGTISGWNSSVNQTQAILKVTTPNAVYKGLTIGQLSGNNVLYAANFFSGAVEVYDTNFSPVSLAPGAFTDNQLPPGYAPFNVQNISGNIFVSWAEQGPDKHDEVDGPGLGYVDEYSPDGTLLLRLQHGDYMNAPWGMVQAPLVGFGAANRLIVGNFGSGQIATFNARTGAFKGMLNGSNGQPLTIDGLWGIMFGNGGGAGSTKALYFASGPGDESHGLFGNITFTKQ